MNLKRYNSAREVITALKAFYSDPARWTKGYMVWTPTRWHFSYIPDAWLDTLPDDAKTCPTGGILLFSATDSVAAEVTALLAAEISERPANRTPTPENIVMYWNDHIARSVADVIALLDKATPAAWGVVDPFALEVVPRRTAPALAPGAGRARLQIGAHQ